MLKGKANRSSKPSEQAFEKYLRDEGIRHEKTIPKTPQQNGVAERLNRTLVESARSMLLDANLSKQYWAEAVSMAVYLRNRCPTKAVEGKTPYEAWYGQKPKVDHLRVFGCDAFAHIPKDERGKFDTKTRKCILLGYGKETKAYRLYDISQKKILYSRDVQFNEETKECRLDSPVDEYKLILEFQSDTISETSYDNEHSEHSEDEQPDQSDQNVMPIRRSTRLRKQPDYFDIPVCHLTETPTTFKQAGNSQDKMKWKAAMETEMNSLQENDVWNLVKLPTGRKIVGSKWVFKKKTGADGTVERYKARLVAQGFTQKQTFCPVVRQESLRMLIALSVQQDLKLQQVDVITAFLNGSLEEEVFMRQPEGFEVKGKEKLVCKVKKSIYGLKQSPRCWNAALDSKLREI